MSYKKKFKGTVVSTKSDKTVVVRVDRKKTHSRYHKKIKWSKRCLLYTSPGRMGGVRVTVQNLAVVSIDTEKGLLLIRGAVPGKRNAMLLIRPSVKKSNAPHQVLEPVKKSA